MSLSFCPSSPTLSCMINIKLQQSVAELADDIIS